MSNQELQTIDPAALAQVSGGTTASTSTASSSDQILTALNGILTSIQGLAQNNGGGFNQQEMLMLMMIMQQRNQQQIIAPGNAWGGWGQPPIYYY